MRISAGHLRREWMMKRAAPLLSNPIEPYLLLTRDVLWYLL
jgi:hypothetical protein